MTVNPFAGKTFSTPWAAPVPYSANGPVQFSPGLEVGVVPGEPAPSCAGYLAGRGAHYLLIVEHDAHCAFRSVWCVKQSRLIVFDLDTQALAASAGDVDGVELAALDLVQHGLAGHSERLGGRPSGSQPSGTSGRIRSRSAWVMRIRQGAPGVSCSPVMKPSRSHR